MFNKTNIAAAAVATLVATAGVATAENYFGLTMDRDEGASTITLPLVRAEADGFVAIYDYNTGEVGELLGQEMINAGANADVKVNLGEGLYNDIIAVIYAGDVTTPADSVAWTEIEVNDSM